LRKNCSPDDIPRAFEDMSALHANEKDVPDTGSPSRPNYDPVSPASSVSLDKDVAIGLVGEHARDYDPAVEARVLRKIDLFLIPAMIIGMCQPFLQNGQENYVAGLLGLEFYLLFPTSCRVTVNIS